MKWNARPLRTAITILTVAALTVGIGSSVDSKEWMSFGGKTALFAAKLWNPDAGQWISMTEQDGSHISSGSLPENGTGTTSSTTVETPESDNTTQVNVTTAPPRSKKGGTVITDQLSSGNYVVEKVAVKNSANKSIDIAKQFSIRPAITVRKDNTPQVLILHTHTTECYLGYDAGYYNDDDPTRTRDAKKNMVAVGEAIAEQLRAAGIGVIHDTTEHDYPQYNGAYSRSLATANRVLSQNDHIVAVLDIHRDCIMRSDTEKVKPTVTIDGKQAAQLMILTSVSNTDAVPHPKWKENLRFALQLQNNLNTEYEGLMRPLNLVGARYNQHLAPASMLVEVGSDANTLDEAIYAGELFGKEFAALLVSMQA